MNTNSGTPISEDALLERGYKKHNPNPVMDTFDYFFQKRIRDEKGTLYFINFRHWSHGDNVSWDCELNTDSDSDGYLWATIKEHTIEKSEARIRALWEASGGKYYDQD